ncbi:aldehyde oxidase 1-like [Anolis carolinensis]|uniref:aldehyde oxidase n=1 Tax=Anolis carolinensis TaxID=28377 RepID=M1ZMM8_ANOCA|nr:aldehyde oxidase 1-like [Anolis carolinensis]DAA64414.1 TPA_inf: aldehyde oxidase 1 [Anolis carolinensis]|eukprot:NP_001280177.1 aldehyde oxidase 1-like [Anolis carolinensis]
MPLPGEGAPKASNELLFYVNGKRIVEKNADPEHMLLSYLRKRLHLTGTKYGCGGGGCGACTVMISRYESATKKIIHYSANACLIPICSLYGAAVVTVEGIGNTKTRIHPVQERIAKSHGSQCGFCTPGMVMSIYALLRNHMEPTSDQIIEALAGNLCRCTGYRPIIDGFKTFCKESVCCQNKENGVCCLDQEDQLSLLPNKEENTCTTLFPAEEFQPLDPTQELIFPPELIKMVENQTGQTLIFHGERTTWISPVNLNELLELKAKYPQAPLVIGNTSVGPQMKFKGVFHPVIISPTRILDLHVVKHTGDGLILGAGCSLTVVKDALTKAVSKLAAEKTKIFSALLQQLKTLGGQQIRNVASFGGNIITRSSTSDLNPILAVGNCILNVASQGKLRHIPFRNLFADGFGNNTLEPDEILLSIHIPYSQKNEFVSAFRQAQRRENALPIVNAGMRVLFEEGSNIIKDFSIFYGGVGPTTMAVKETCQALIGRPWDEQMLDDACRMVLKEILLPSSAPGGKIEFRRTLIASFIFKFYLEVLQSLQMKCPSQGCSVPDNYASALESFHTKMPQNMQKFQDVEPGQSAQDPVGHPMMHQAGIKHATGEAVYCDDIRTIDGELFLALVTSAKAHANIVSIDVSEALKISGVVDIISVQNVPGQNEFYDHNVADIIFAREKVTCVGQIVCAVVADSDVHAKRAAAKVKIEYEPQEPVILTIEDGIKHNSFFEPQRKLTQGNVDEAFKKADHILEGEIHVGGQEHFYMETQSILAVPKGEDKEMDVYVSSQYPAHVQEMVASCLGVPSNRIMCHVKRIGGAFGGKLMKTSVLACITAVAANKTGQAVRCILDRGTDMLTTGGRHPLIGKYKVGFMNNGKILALDFDGYFDGGCTPDESIMVTEMALLKIENAYKIPNFRFSSRACKTNKPSNGAFRGFGFPQSGLVTESWITRVAARCGLPPEQVREINMYKENDLIPCGQELQPENLHRCWNECMEKSAYHTRKEAVDDFNRKNYWKKKGIAIIPLKFPVGFAVRCFGQASALVHLYTDGSLLLTHGGVEMGQGLHTKMIQVASRELKMPVSNIHICETSTTTIPNAIGSVGSQGTDVNGMAVKDACQTLLKRLEPIITQNPKGTWKEWAKEAFEESISLSATGYFRGYELNMDWEKEKSHPFEYFVYGAACSEVEIDCLTGDHKNIRTDIVIDSGYSINPAVDIGQIEGAFIQGLGLYTKEELKYSAEGVLYTQGPDQYKIPGVCDIPEQFSVSLLQSSQKTTAIYSSKGLGEAAVFLGCSVFFAIWDAVVAVRKERELSEDFELNSPLTPERIRMACADQFTEMIPKDKCTASWAISL